MIMKPKHLVFLALLACIGRSTWASQGSSVCKQRIVYTWTYHSYGSPPDIKAKDDKIVRRCDHNQVFPCWNFSSCGTSGVGELRIIGRSYDDFARLRIDGTIVPGICTVDDICTCPNNTNTENCAIGYGILGIVVFFLSAVIFCCALEKIPCVHKVMRSYCYNRIPWGCSDLPTSTQLSDTQLESGSDSTEFQDHSLSHPPVLVQPSAKKLPEGVEETQSRRRHGPACSFQRTTGNLDSCKPPLSAAMPDDTQLPRDQEPTDGERVGQPTEETCTAC